MKLMKKINANSLNLKPVNWRHKNIGFILFISVIWVLKFLSIKTGVFYNPDEFEWLYIIEKCRLDCSLGSFDSHTAGPLAIWMLRLAFGFFNEINVENLHLIRLGIEIVTFLIVGFSQFNSPQQRIAVIAFLVLFLSLPQSDFYAYNTEFVVLPVLAWLTFRPNADSFFQSLITIILVLLMPLIKLQTLPLSLLFLCKLFFDMYRQSNVKHIVGLLFFVFILLLTAINSFTLYELNELYFNYIEKNIWYTKEFSSNSYWNAFVLMIQTFLHPLRLISIIVFAITLRLNFFELNKLNVKFILWPLALVFTSLICVLTPKTDFLHYYILLIIPLTYIIFSFTKHSCYLKMRLRTLTIIMMIFTIYNIVYFSSKGSTLIWKEVPNIKIEHESSCFDNKYKKMDSIFIEEYLKSGIRNSVFVSGWFDAQPLYYRYRNISSYTYRSNITLQLSTLKGALLKREIAQLVSDFKKNGFPLFIVVTNSYSINDVFFVNLLSGYRIVNKDSSNGLVYKRLDKI
jgi:hypothetical protein